MLCGKFELKHIFDVIQSFVFSVCLDTVYFAENNNFFFFFFFSVYYCSALFIGLKSLFMAMNSA